MKNKTLADELKSIVATKGVIVEKGSVGGNSIQVTKLVPVFEDLGSYTYYNDVNKRDADFNELQKLIADETK